MRLKPSLLYLTNDWIAGVERHSALDLFTYTDSGYHDHAKEMLGFEPDYGNLTAYMIRRFGYPNHPGDPDKDLTGGWRLATGKEDLLLTVRPTPSGSGMTALNFTASVPMGAKQAFREWLDRPRAEWQSRIFDAIEAEGLPEWMPALFQAMKDSPFVRGEDWRALARALPMFESRGIPVPAQGLRRELAGVADEWAGIVARHIETLPDPGFRERIGSWKTWDDTDPQKPYMAALQAAFDDLKRPVFVRDVAIGLQGAITDEDLQRRTAAPQTDTGVYPAGLIIHSDPEAFGDLLRAVHLMGDGDMGAGMRALVALADRDMADPEPSTLPEP
ncbi:hypothetical protein [Paracoccus sp. ME4]|uniref:hypothetical protein n=1 Tax=Paracoccus sp. ME4 TaxID=3138066 RepID=UPI00398ABB0D